MFYSSHWQVSPIRCIFFVSAQTQQSSSGNITSNSHSTAASSDTPKATFPAYTQSSVSSSSSASVSSNPSSSTVAKPPATVTNKPATLTTTSATSKLIHPDEDISLVSCLSFLFFTFYTVSNDWYI